MEIKYIDNLPVERWEEYKILRLNALRNDPSAFSSELEEVVNDTNEDWKNKLSEDQENNHKLVFAEYGGRLIGMGSIGFYKKERFKHNASIEALYVEPEYRGQGVATGLLESMIELARENSVISDLISYIYGTQVESINLHKKLGFEVVGAIKDFVHTKDKDFDMFILQKKLK
jgi:L-amino acid N-acyltransferase YncA